jgi:hypothetical protein
MKLCKGDLAFDTAAPSLIFCPSFSGFEPGSLLRAREITRTAALPTSARLRRTTVASAEVVRAALAAAMQH